MKKLFLILLLFICESVYAIQPVELVSISNKCSVVNHNKTIIAIEVLNTNEGELSKLIHNYKLGNLEHAESYDLHISHLESKYINHLLIDTLRDSNQRSNVNYMIEDDVKLKKNETFASFWLEIEILEDVPKSIYVLGNQVILSADEQVCERINGYKGEVIEINQSIVHDKKIYIFLILLGGICLGEFYFLLLKGRKK